MQKMQINLLEYERRKGWIVDAIAYMYSLLPKVMQINNLSQDMFRNQHFDELIRFVEDTEPDKTLIAKSINDFVKQMCSYGVHKSVVLVCLILTMDDYVYTHNCTPPNTSLTQESFNTNVKDTGIQVFEQNIFKCSHKLLLDYPYTEKTLNSRLKYFYLINIKEFGLKIKIMNISGFIKDYLKIALIQVGNFCQPYKHTEYEDSSCSYVNLFLEKDIQERLMISIKIQINIALSLGVNVIVFSELIGSEEIINYIYDLITSLKNRDDFIVICPSFHMKLSSGQYKNITKIWGGDGSLIANVAKINPAHIKDEKNNGRFIKENIVPGDILHLFQIDNIGNMALLICADCLSNFLPYLLNECNAKLIIVPSFSPKTEQFDKILPAFSGNAAIELYWNACSALLDRTAKNNSLIGKICHHDDIDNPLRIMCSGICNECKECNCNTNKIAETEHFYSETIQSGAGCMTVLTVKKI